MAFSNLSSAQVGQLIELVKEKESLQGKLERVNQALQHLESGGDIPKRRGRKPGSKNVAKAEPTNKAAKRGRPSKRGKRLKEPLLEALKSAGSAGISVKDLSAKLKVKPGNIFSWFYTTGKKIKGISKVGEAKYAYSA
jgi:ribosome-binding protein aMBF1 (putative translation factor)